MAAGKEAQVNQRLSRWDRTLAWLVSWLGWGVLQILGKTSRLRTYRSPSLLERQARGLPIIYAFWHRYQLLMAYDHRHLGAHVLVSQSRDGEFIARVLHRLGYRTVRGSSSRGGTAAFRALCQVVANGSVGFTPDGPRGPSRSIQPGLVALAAKTGVPVVPAAWAGTRVWEFNSWDRFLAPKPFGRCAVIYGDPIFITEEGPQAEAVLRDALNGAEAEAQELLRKC